MTSINIEPISCFNGQLSFPGDKSMAHRALIFAALARGESQILNLPDSLDVKSTIDALRGFGVEIAILGSTAKVLGNEPLNWRKPDKPIDAGNSGTTARLLLGVCSAFPGETYLDGDDSLRKRPMGFLSSELKKFGSKIDLTESSALPAVISGGNLKASKVKVSKNSAQLKTALILAALSADGESELCGKLASRDHTERMLTSFGVELNTEDSCLSELLSQYLDDPEREYTLKIKGRQRISPFHFTLPGDPSTAAYFQAAAALIPGGKVKTMNVSLNPTRLGFLRVLKRMGAKVQIEYLDTSENFISEPMGHVEVNYHSLKGVDVHPQEIPFLIDELPLIAVLGAFASGKTTVRGATELRLKESDRIKSLAENFKTQGVNFLEKEDGFEISGDSPFQGGSVDSFGDHRIAMAFAIGALRSSSPVEIKDSNVVGISYPKFFNELKRCKYV